jgi:hypothetical protein
MKLFTGWVLSAGLVLTAAAANAQVLAPNPNGRPAYAVVSDFEGPYAAMPPDAPVPPRYGYGPTLLPPQEVYTVVRDGGFSPLGAPQLRGFVYSIAVVDRRGDDGRLVIDARNGRILRFMPAYRMGDNFRGDMTYGPVGPAPAISPVAGAPRPPASIPHLASRSPSSVPLPKASPPRTDEMKPLAAKPAAEPAQQSAAVQAKPADTATAPPAAAPAAAAKPAAPAILPTQEMPKAQGLE